MTEPTRKQVEEVLAWWLDTQDADEYDPHVEVAFAAARAYVNQEITDEMVERADQAYVTAISEHPDPVRHIIEIRREAIRAALEAATRGDTE